VEDRSRASLGVFVVFIEGVQAALSRFTGARSGDFGSLFQEVSYGMARLGFVEEKGGLRSSRPRRAVMWIRSSSSPVNRMRIVGRSSSRIKVWETWRYAANFFAREVRVAR